MKLSLYFFSFQVTFVNKHFLNFILTKQYQQKFSKNTLQTKSHKTMEVEAYNTISAILCNVKQRSIHSECEPCAKNVREKTILTLEFEI